MLSLIAMLAETINSIQMDFDLIKTSIDRIRVDNVNQTQYDLSGLLSALIEAIVGFGREIEKDEDIFSPSQMYQIAQTSNWMVKIICYT